MCSARRSLVACLFLLVFSQAAFAAVSIQYSVVPMGGNVYRYIYSISNLGVGPAVQLFDILFDTSLYQEGSLQIVTPSPLNTQWSQQILHSIPPGVPASYDALSLTGGIPSGTTVSGFSVQFTYLGSGTPGAQPFQVYDPGTLNLVQSGQAVPAPSVPVASTLSLILLAIGLAATTAYQLRAKVAQAIELRSPERR